MFDLCDGGQNLLPPGWDPSENLGATAVALVPPADTSMHIILFIAIQE